MFRILLVGLMLTIALGCKGKEEKQFNINSGLKTLPGKTLGDAVRMFGPEIELTFYSNPPGQLSGVFAVLDKTTLLELQLKYNPDLSLIHISEPTRPY